MDENNSNYQEGSVNPSSPVTPQPSAAGPVQPGAAAGGSVIYQQPVAQQTYYAGAVMPQPNGYGMYSRPVQPVQPLQTVIPVQAQPYRPATAMVPVQPVAQAAQAPQPAEQNAAPRQENGDSGNGGKRSIVLPVVFAIALALLFIYTLAQSFYIVRLNRKLNETAPAETTTEPGESETDESGESSQPGESEEPTETGEDGKPWFSIEKGAAATDPNKKALRTTEIVAEASPATIPVYIMRGSGSSEKKAASGTGFIISMEGYIVTNAHVVQYVTKSPRQYSVTVLLPDDDKPIHAEIVGSDTQTDIAILKVETDKKLPYLKFGDSDKLMSGELVIAIGNALGQLDDTVTVGVVSATNRDISSGGYNMRVIQTDAAINNGNSGGPLLNSFGEVVGITNAKIATSTSEGLGFAIPVNSVKSVIESLINKGKVTDRPFLGVSVKDCVEGEYEDGEAGVYCMEITRGGPADKAGIKVGDRLISLDGVAIKTTNDIIGVRDSHKVGDSITVVVDRKGTKHTLTLVIGDSGDFQSAETEDDDDYDRDD